MFNANRKTEDSKLDAAINAIFREMSELSSDSDEYAKMADQLTKLYSLKEVESKSRVSQDTLALVIGNLAGIVLIVGHERAHIVTSKAINFVMKLR